MGESIVVVGGGLAGLAASVALTRRGVAVTLLEARSYLGGRTHSFVDRSTGECVNNSQHVAMGCCTNLADFCLTVDVERLFRRDRVLHFVGPDHRISRFTPLPLPAPLHLIPAFARLKFLSYRDRVQIARGLTALARTRSAADSDQSFESWLHERNQSERVCRRFWNVVLVSALGETLDRIGLYHARKVLVDGFLVNRSAWELKLPTVPLDRLYNQPVRRWLTRHGCDVRFAHHVRGIHLERQRVNGIELRDGRILPADHLVLAVPHHQLSRVVPAEIARDASFNQATRLQSSPITAVHLWFDRPITPLAHAAFVEHTIHWLFNHTVIQSDCDTSCRGWNRSNGKHRYEVVISASRRESQVSKAELIQTILSELKSVWPCVGKAELLHSRVVTERHAVFAPVAGVDQLRPVQQTAIPNLQIAGDWTRTGWPSTMEGAVRSGYLAAENVLRHLGQPAQVLCGDLTAECLPKVLFGL